MLHLRFQLYSIYRQCFPFGCVFFLPNPIALIFHDSASSPAFYCWNQLLINNSRLTVKRRKGKLLLSLGKRLIATGREKIAPFCHVKRKLACFKAISIVFFFSFWLQVNISNTWTLPQPGFNVFYRYFRDKISFYEADAVCNFHHGNLVTGNYADDKGCAVDDECRANATRPFRVLIDPSFSTSTYGRRIKMSLRRRQTTSCRLHRLHPSSQHDFELVWLELINWFSFVD